jgi:hypothetical protein
MTFETPQLRPCYWSTMGSTQPHHAARPKAVCSVHAGTHDPGYFEHILGLLHSKSLTLSGQSPAKPKDPADLFLGATLSPSTSCDERAGNDVISITGRHHQTNFRDSKLVSNGRFIIWGCSQLPSTLRF